MSQKRRTPSIDAHAKVRAEVKLPDILIENEWEEAEFDLLIKMKYPRLFPHSIRVSITLRTTTNKLVLRFQISQYAELIFPNPDASFKEQ
jgi:hypothetical protein